ncbi:Protein EFR3 [Sphaceloma murrayae]|uniref:Protein EFR3 n=1 Tax=Sphaceloma murrayae TaxID=2082308 RepID=A0A2K1QS49_9PEZI|nr:Protein EFR3 [Sphaceloma murrayae]
MSVSPKPGSPDSTKSSRSRARASPDRPSSQQIDFEFLNFSHPSEAKASRARRTVRSHVTRQQHHREQQAAAARRTRSFPQSTSPAISRPPRLRTSQTIAIPDHTIDPNIPSLRTSKSAPSSSVASSAPSPLGSPSDSVTGSMNLDPYEVYPPSWQPYISAVFDHYLSNLATENPDLDGITGRVRNSWFPFILSDHGLMHAALLYAASHVSVIRGPDAHPIDLIALRGMALRGINENLQDSAKSLSDEMIASVLTVALHEAMYGDRSTYATHMSGLQKMVTLRGGLANLGLDGFLESMILWVDSNASYATGYHQFFPRDLYPSAVQHPFPTPNQFSTSLPSRSQSS